MPDNDNPAQPDLASIAEALLAALENEPRAAALPFQPHPLVLGASGLYRWSPAKPVAPRPVSVPLQPFVAGMGGDIEGEREGDGEPEEALAAFEDEDAALPIAMQREELRLDVDGRYPQMAASGTIFRFGLAQQVHWIARLRRIGANAWAGPIWYKDGAVATFPYSFVRIAANTSFFPHLRRATAVFSGGGVWKRTRSYDFVSPYFHEVEFEYDHEAGIAPVLEILTGAHPNRPPSLPVEKLSIDTVFRRSGFDVTRGTAVSAIPTDGPDPGTTWSDAEMHDAMQVYWSRFDARPQWALWTLFAKQHDMGTGLGGIMFDDIGPNHRQGTSLFYDSFISQAPAGDPAPAAWVARERFWTAVHEMGHAFNLAHSWQKHLGTPWIPLAPEPEARSFMNYPDAVTGGEPAFFGSFEFRFSDAELLFMRHAPARFVQMGNADWFDHHGFENAVTESRPALGFEISVDQPNCLFEFLEPVVLEARVVNLSAQPQIVPSDLLVDAGRLTVVIKRNTDPARQWAPYATYCHESTNVVLNPGQALAASLFVSAGLNGFDLAEPGRYLVQAAIELEGRQLISNPLCLRVAPDRDHEERLLAQDVFTEDAGRVMAFDGSKQLESGIEAWAEVVERLPKSRAAVHARIALAMPLTRTYRELVVDRTAGAAGARCAFRTTRPQLEEGKAVLSEALLAHANAAATTLGRVDYAYYCDRFAGFLKEAGADAEAKKVEDTRRKVHAALGRGRPAQAAAE